MSSPKPEPLVLIHGFTAGPAVWDPIVPRLARHHAVHALSLDGHRGGAPLGAQVEPSIGALADGLERELDRLGLPDAHLVGNSLGGWLALELAARGRARSVVCLAPAGGWEPGGVFDRALAARFAGAFVLGRLLAPRGLARPRLRRAFLSATVEHPDRVPIPTAIGALEDVAGCSVLLPMLLRTSRRALRGLGAISCPVRIAWSENDRILDARHARARFAQLVPHAEQIELAGVGHVPMSDDPELVAQTVLEVTAAGLVARAA